MPDQTSDLTRTPSKSQRRAFAEVRGRQLHFAERGSGEPLLLIHPTGLSSRGYNKLMAHLDGYRVLAPDLFGCGYSDELPPELATQPSMEAFSDVLVEFLDAVHVEKAHVFGAHLGNKLGAALAARHPGRVASCFFTGHTHSLVLDRNVRNRSYPNNDRLTKWSEGGALQESGWNDLLDEVTLLWRIEDQSGHVPLSWRLDQAYDEVLCRILCMHAYGALYSANFSFDFENAVREIASPVHVLELLVPEEASLLRQAPLWANALTRLTSESLETDLRSLLYGQPAALAARLRAFISASASTRSA